MNSSHLRGLLLCTLLLAASSVSLSADEAAGPSVEERPKLKFADQFAPGALDFGADNRVKQWTVSASFQVNESGGAGTLLIAADVAEGWHVYSVTQKGGPGPLKIRLAESKGVELAGGFKPNRPPHVIKNDPIFETDIEYHEGKVNWTAPLRFAKDADPKSLKLDVKLSGQVCNDKVGCVPFDLTIPAKFAGHAKPSNEAVPAKTESTEAASDSIHVVELGLVDVAIVATVVILVVVVSGLFCRRASNRAKSTKAAS